MTGTKATGVVQVKRTFDVPATVRAIQSDAEAQVKGRMDALEKEVHDR